MFFKFHNQLSIFLHNQKSFYNNFFFYMAKVICGFGYLFSLQGNSWRVYSNFSSVYISNSDTKKNGAVICLHFVSYLFMSIDLYASKLVGMILCCIIEKCNIEPSRSHKDFFWNIIFFKTDSSIALKEPTLSDKWCSRCKIRRLSETIAVVIHFFSIYSVIIQKYIDPWSLALYHSQIMR